MESAPYFSLLIMMGSSLAHHVKFCIVNVISVHNAFVDAERDGSSEMFDLTSQNLVMYFLL
jgi:hypothetical protein